MYDLGCSPNFPASRGGKGGREGEGKRKGYCQHLSRKSIYSFESIAVVDTMFYCSASWEHESTCFAGDVKGKRERG